MKKIEIKFRPTDNEIKEAIFLDSENYENIDVGEFERCISWYKKNKEIYTLLKVDNVLVGYINFVPLTNECYEKYRRGELKDYQLTSDDIIPFKPNNKYNCLLMSIVIQKKYRDSEYIKILWNGFKQRIKYWKENNIVMQNILADCVSKDGIRFFEKYLQFKYLLSHANGKIYEGKIS